MIPVHFGDDNLPVALDYHSRFAQDTFGAVIDSAPNAMPPIAESLLVIGDVLSTSPTARGARDTVEQRRLYVPGLIEGLNAALSGRRSDADKTVITGTKLAVAGYVNPFDLVAGASRPDIPLISADLKLVP